MKFPIINDTVDASPRAAFMTVLKNRLRGSFDFYNKETRDLLISRVLPPSAGFPSIYYNSGNLLNRGIEFSLEADIIERLYMDVRGKYRKK